MMRTDFMAVLAALVLDIMSMVSVCETEETCSNVEFLGYKDGDTVRAIVNSYVNVTFNLNTSNCTYTPDWFRFKVSFSQASFNVGICSILIKNRTCSITDLSVYCRCTHDARDSAILYRQFNQSGRSVYIWNWSDSVRKQVQRKAEISFDVQVDDNGNTHDSTVTSTSGIPTAAGGDNLNVIFVTSAITAAVIIVPIIIVISVYVYRRRKDFMAVRASLVLVIMLMVSVCETEETCADVEFAGYKDGDIVRALVNSYINVTFHLNTSNCTYTPEWFRFKVSLTQGGFNVGICSVLIQNRTCSITDLSVYCRCTHDARGSALLYRQFNQSGRSVYIWNWSDSASKQVQKKAQISFDVEVDDNGSTHDSTVTSTSGIPTAAGGDNLNVIFVTSAITAAVIIVPIITIISIYVYRRRKARAIHPSADDRLEENPDTAPSQSLPLQENRRSLRKEYEYSEITDEAAPRNSSPDRVHENYEHPLQDEGASHSDYSRLEYKGLWRNGNGNGNGKDDSNTKMAELPVSDVATTEQQAGPTVTYCLPDDYLEPVITDTGTTSPPLPKLAS